jgi:hypothetical protein
MASVTLNTPRTAGGTAPAAEPSVALPGGAPRAPADFRGLGADAGAAVAALAGRSAQAPASASFLAVLGVEAGPAGPEGEAARLVAVRVELGAVRAELASASARLSGVLRELDAAVRDAQEAQSNLTHMQAALRSARKKKKGLAAVLTVAGFAVGGPLVGNLVGFAALKSVADMDRAQRRESSRKLDAEQRVRGLSQQRDALVAEKAKLDARAAVLEARGAPFEAAADAALAAGPEDRLSALAAAGREGRQQLQEAKALLADLGRLTRRAQALGVRVEALKVSLQAEVGRLEAEVAAAEREVRAAVFELGFAALAAARGLGALAAGEARVLKVALRVAQAAEAPPEARAAALAETLVGLSFPADAPAARAVAQAAVAGLLAPAPVDPAALAEAALRAGLAAAERGWLEAALALPDAGGLAATLDALLALPAARRTDAAALFRVLSAGPA